ncbi:MAG: FHA domain-containing protein [Anaerolineae bacterium]|nr:FHA domain-containing protein [Anaerolineae bacterium]
MKKIVQVLTTLAVIAACIFFPYSAVKADTQGEIRINLISTYEAEDAMTLKLYFNLYDPATGTPFTVLKVKDAQMTLLKTNFVSPVEIKEPDLPIYVTMVLDASGSMAASASKLQEAAKLALNNPPDDSLFAIVQFDEEIKLLQDFTENISAINFAIDAYKTSINGTCLYDAAYTAVEAQANAPAGRRAVILFTDGTDEKRDGTQCSQKSYQELIALAMEMQVPIHTIGLSSTANKLNEVELRSMASSTGGYSAIANQDALDEAFANIMTALKAQWMAEAIMYPKDGTNEAVFTMTLEDNTTLNTAFSFESNSDYPGPPSPVTFRFDGLQMVPDGESYDLQVSLTSPELVGYIKVALWDSDAGSKVTEYIFEDPASFNTFNIPTDAMNPNRKYEFRIMVISEADNTAFVLSRDNQDNETTEYVHSFTFDPSATLPGVSVLSISQDGSDMILRVATTNADRIAAYDGWLVSKDTNIQVPNSAFRFEGSDADDGILVIPTRQSRLKSGAYSVVLRALDSGNQVLSSVTIDEVTFTAPGLIERIGFAFITEPLFLGIVAGVILLVVVFLVLTSRRQKSLSGTPVMQGQLGKKMKGKKPADGLQALAVDEPVFQQTPSQQPVSYSPPPASTPTPAAVPVRQPSSRPVPDTIAEDNSPTIIPGAGGGATLTDFEVSAAKRPYLTGLAGPKTGTWEVTTFPYLIGRNQGALMLAESSISRQHAQITKDGSGNYYLTDLGSSNGTLVDSVKLSPGQPILLKDQVVIKLGTKVSLRFEMK